MRAETELAIASANDEGTYSADESERKRRRNHTPVHDDGPAYVEVQVVRAFEQAKKAKHRAVFTRWMVQHAAR